MRSHLEPLESRQLLAFVFWDGGGGDGNWHNPLNWSSDVLPGASDAVFIDAPTPTTVHIGQDVNVQSIWSLESVELTAGTVTVAQPWKQGASMTMSGGTLQGAGNLELSGEMVWSGGTIAGGAAKIQVLPGSTLTISGDVTLARQLVNNGDVVWQSGDITATDARIHNLPGRSFSINGGRDLLRVGAQSYFNNYGTVSHEGTSSTIGILFNNSCDPARQGTVDVHDGTLTFAGPVAGLSSIVYVQPGAVWKASSSTAHLVLPAQPGGFLCGTYVLSEPGSSINILEQATYVFGLELSGGRAFDLAAMVGSYGFIASFVIDNSGMTTALPSLTITSLHVEAGDVTFNSGYTSGGSWLMVSGTPSPALTVDAGATVTLGSVTTLAFTRISGAGLIRVIGELQWPSGSMEGPGQLLITAGGRLTSVGQYFQSFDRTVTRRIVNYGVMDFTINNGYTFSLSAEIVNRGMMSFGSTFTFGFIQTTAGIGPGNAPGYITNLGTLNVLSPLTLRGAGGGVRLNNQGTVRTYSLATLTLNGGAYGGGTWIADPSSEIVFGGLGSYLSGANLAGEGRYRVACIATWTTNTVTGAGDMVVGTAGRLTLLGNFNAITRSALTNLGTVSVTGAAAVVGSFVNHGTLSLGPSTLLITGNLSMGTTSAVRVTGPTTGGPLIPSRITVSGTASLAGSLHLAYPAPMPAGSFFQLLQMGAYTGTFSGGTTASGLAPGTFALFSLNGQSGTVTVATAI